MNEDLEEKRNELVNQCTDIMAYVSSTDWAERASLLQQASTLMTSLLAMNCTI